MIKFWYLIKRIYNSIRHPKSIFFPHAWSHEVFIRYLKEKGAIIGKNTRFISPSHCSIDPGRLDYIEIGDNCCLSVVSILAHDYSWYTLLGSCDDILPDPGGRVVIGNNCFIGYQALILKGTTIGDNVIIGARAVVKGSIPSNTVWAGVPARQVCTIEDFYKKKVEGRLEDALYRKNHILRTKRRNPNIEEMGFFSFIFLDRTEENYKKYIKTLEFNGIKDCSLVREYFFKTKPLMTFEDFLNH